MKAAPPVVVKSTTECLIADVADGGLTLTLRLDPTMESGPWGLRNADTSIAESYQITSGGTQNTPVGTGFDTLLSNAGFQGTFARTFDYDAKVSITVEGYFEISSGNAANDVTVYQTFALLIAGTPVTVPGNNAKLRAKGLNGVYGHSTSRTFSQKVLRGQTLELIVSTKASGTMTAATASDKVSIGPMTVTIQT